MEPFYLPTDPAVHERENKKWREAARYDLAENLVFQLRDISWPALIDAHAQSWHVSAVWGFSRREADRDDGKYPWVSLETKLDNVVRSRFTPVRRVTLPGIPAAGLAASSFDCVGRLIRRYTPQNNSGCPRFAALVLPIPTPAQTALRTMERLRNEVREVFFGQLDAGPVTRQFLAERLAHAHRIVEVGTRLNDALAYRSSYCRLTPADLGGLLGSVEYFRRCWEDFHKAEHPAAITKISAPTAPPAKHYPAADVRRYFPAVAAILGDNPTDESALADLAIWLLGWAERHGHRPESSRYSLAGQLREQQAAHPDAGKFLKACHRLHKVLLPLAATEQTAKTLLGSRYGPHSRQNLQAVLTWWAAWVREQQAAHHDPAGAYLAALKRVPVVEEWENGSPRYTLPAYLLDMEGFTAEIAPLRQAFEAALPDLPTKKKQAIRYELNELLGIDLAGVKRRREQFERGEYGLNFLAADYPALRFDVAGQPGSFKWQWVGPLFWGGLSTLLQYRQGAARAVCEQLTAALPEAARFAEAPASSPALSPAASARPLSTSNPLPIPYFHISPDGIARRFKLRNEAHNAGRRQAMCNLLRKGLIGQQRQDFENEKSSHDTNINVYYDWLETKLFYKKQELSIEEAQLLHKAIDEEAASISVMLPYSDSYGPYFIKKLKAEPLLKVSEFLQFTREPWYAGLAGFYLLSKPDDISYFRDLITEHLERQPEDATPVMHRAIEWLNAEIERLALPGANAFSISAPSAPQPEANAPDPGLPTLSPADVWADRLKPGISFSLADLDRLLASTGLVVDAASRTPTAEFRGTALAGIVEALRYRNYLQRNNTAKLAALLAERYGRDVANPHTIGRNYVLLPAAAQQPYTRALAFLPTR